MIIDRLTPATRNGLANAIRGWPKIMSLYQAFKKRKLYSSWSMPSCWISASGLLHLSCICLHLSVICVCICLQIQKRLSAFVCDICLHLSVCCILLRLRPLGHSTWHWDNHCNYQHDIDHCNYQHDIEPAFQPSTNDWYLSSLSIDSLGPAPVRQDTSGNIYHCSFVMTCGLHPD